MIGKAFFLDPSVDVVKGFGLGRGRDWRGIMITFMFIFGFYIGLMSVDVASSWSKQNKYTCLQRRLECDPLSAE